jgi:aspartate/methionine/tyrosine aminotransferase
VLIIVSPNNPTGSYVSAREVEQLLALCRDRGWVLIADEVFADYSLEVDAPLTDLASQAEVLTFSLGGLSKTVGLPQLKLAWLVAGGPPEARARALTGLELIADSFLSVSTPVQIAVPSLLECGAAIRAQIHQRVRDNLAMLRDVARSFPACEIFKVEGGWSAVVRVPATRTEDQLVLGLLDAEGIVVHPGYFFDFPREAFLVVSLLPQTETLREGALRVLRYVAS